MQVFRNIEEIQLSIPSEEKVGGTTFTKKKINELHDGHIYVLDSIKNDVDVDKLLITFSNNTNAIVYYYPESGTTADTIWDEEYCLTWAENNGVDYIFIPPDNFFGDALLSTINIETLKQQVETIFTNENYNNVITTDDHYLSRYTILTYLIFNELQLNQYKNKHYCSWEFSISNFVREDFCNKYTDMDVVILDPFRRSDGLIYSSRLVGIPQDKINIFLNVRDLVLTSIQNNENVSIPDLENLLDNQYTLTSLWLNINLSIVNRKYVEWHLQDSFDSTKNYRFGEII